MVLQVIKLEPKAQFSSFFDMELKKLEKARAKMLREIKETAVDTASWTGREIFSVRTMTAIENVPRHLFVSQELNAKAYANRPQEIGQGQTISQPYIVALMTDFLDLVGNESVLEIGTGCGYHAAVIANCIPDGFLYSIENIGSLADGAIRRLRDLGCGNVSVRCGNGFNGWPDAAPFDTIIVTAAPKSVPKTLVRQLENGGRMILPVGQPHKRQMLTLIRKDSDGHVTKDNVLPVTFVPMVDFDSI